MAEIDDAAAVNQALLAGWAALRDDADVTRSHYFAGRYENLYVPETRLPALKPVLEEARRLAAAYLQQPDVVLDVGFWFNEMAPGQVTVAHSHDEDDELVSGVYYVRVPEDSGELVLRRDGVVTRVTPVEGRFVLFPPDLVHEVTENRSAETRLSIGMNFGPRR